MTSVPDPTSHSCVTRESRPGLGTREPLSQKWYLLVYPPRLYVGGMTPRVRRCPCLHIPTWGRKSLENDNTYVPLIVGRILPILLFVVGDPRDWDVSRPTNLTRPYLPASTTTRLNTLRTDLWIVKEKEKETDRDTKTCPLLKSGVPRKPIQTPVKTSSVDPPSMMVVGNPSPVPRRFVRCYVSTRGSHFSMGLVLQLSRVHLW